jgi:microcystin-dependent protein
MATDYLKNFIDGEAILASETNANNQYLLEQIDERARALQTYLENQVSILQGSFVLPGFIMGLPFDSVPTGYLKCDGSSLLREDYEELFKAIGTIYGAVDDYHFNLPNFQGVFFRGAGGQAASLGVKQGSAVPNITGGFWVNMSSWGAYGAFNNTGSGIMIGGSGLWNENSNGVNIDAARSSSVYKNVSEVRPDNYALVWVIKY